MAVIGSIIDNKYEILKLIGRGGMSEVYLAMDVNLNKQWAVKEIKKENTPESKIAVESAMIEAGLIKELDHPSIPRIVDILDYDEVVYIIMDYIEGEPLSHILSREEALSEEAVLIIAESICNVLIYLHSQEPPIIYDKLIFINELNDKIYMLYRPLNNRQAGGNVYGFLDNLILKIKKYNAELTDACDELHVFFADVNHYKVSEIVELLNRVYPRIYREIKAPETEIKLNKLDTIIDSRGNDGTTFLDVSSRTSNGNEIKEKIKSIIKLIAKDNSCIIDVNNVDDVLSVINDSFEKEFNKEDVSDSFQTYYVKDNQIIRNDSEWYSTCIGAWNDEEKKYYIECYHNSTLFSKENETCIKSS